MSLRLPRIRQNVIALGQSAPNFLLYVSQDIHMKSIHCIYSISLYSQWFVDLESELSPQDLSRFDLNSSSWKIYVTGYNSPPVHKHLLVKTCSKRTFEVLVVSDNSTALYDVPQERFAHNKSHLSLDGFYNTNGTQDYSTQFNMFHVHSP